MSKILKRRSRWRRSSGPVDRYTYRRTVVVKDAEPWIEFLIDGRPLYTRPLPVPTSDAIGLVDRLNTMDPTKPNAIRDAIARFLAGVKQSHNATEPGR